MAIKNCLESSRVCTAPIECFGHARTGPPSVNRSWLSFWSSSPTYLMSYRIPTILSCCISMNVIAHWSYWSVLPRYMMGTSNFAAVWPNQAAGPALGPAGARGSAGDNVALYLHVFFTQATVIVLQFVWPLSTIYNSDLCFFSSILGTAAGAPSTHPCRQDLAQGLLVGRQDMDMMILKRAAWSEMVGTTYWSSK